MAVRTLSTMTCAAWVAGNHTQIGAGSRLSEKSIEDTWELLPTTLGGGSHLETSLAGVGSRYQNDICIERMKVEQHP